MSGAAGTGRKTRITTGRDNEIPDAVIWQIKGWYFGCVAARTTSQTQLAN